MKNILKISFVRVSLREKILFVKHLSIAIKSGMTLISAVQMIRSQSVSRPLKKILDVVASDLNNGVFLSTSLDKYQHVFGDLFINLVRVGEASGTLTENLAYLAEELSKQDIFRKKVKGAMVYPVIVLIATVIVITILMVFLIPRILPVFANLRVTLPLPTRILIVVSHAFTDYGVWLFVGLAVLIFVFVILHRIRTIRYFIHLSFFYLPILRKITVQVNMASVSRTFGILLKSGIKIVEAIMITSQVIPNLVYQRKLREAAEEVKKGEFVFKSLEMNKKYFPDTFTNLLSVGEHTGNLVENLAYLNEFYERDVDDFTKNMSTVIEPLLLLILGFTVGFIALATILPIYQLTSGI